MKKKSDIYDILILIGLLATLIILIVPLLIIAKYSFPTTDDFSFLYYVGPYWKDSHSVIKTLYHCALYSFETWKTWQGLYFADWLWFVMLALFAEKAYFVCTWLGLFSVILSELFASYIIFHKLYKVSTVRSFIYVLPVIILQILLPISGMEAFFWMASVAIYTFPFACMVAFSSLLVYYVFREEDKRINAFEMIVLFLFAFIIAGSGYITGLPTLCLIPIMIVFSFIGKKKNSAFLIILFVFYLAFFAFNALSPGAGIRQSAAGEGDTAIHAILISFVESAKYIKTWTNLPIILTNICLMPLFVFNKDDVKVKYRFPILVTAVSYALFSSMFTPNLYALKIIGMYRVQNIYRFTMYLLITVNLWYWTGFIKGIVLKKIERKETKKNNITLFGILRVTVAAIAVVGVLFSVYKTYGKTSTSVSAFYSLRENEANIYNEEWQERLVILNDESIKDVVFHPYSRRPYLLFFIDVTDDKDNWINEAYARYFNKDSVILSEE
ncbi:MAG: hypothetical protein J5515_03615 [Lachnospiraceae bacterium]|nr:hypothetical protein [Lachnospiraceae bacterium]